MKATEHSWVGAPRPVMPEDEQLLRDNRAKVVVLADASDPSAGWDFDDIALCYLRGHGYFLCQANGCSCDSPSEVWTVVKRFKKRSQLRRAIERGEYQGYTLPPWARDELLKAL